ncbi:hypothetical protein J26TS2_00400 [Shouchella clausii]|nr:hypothetical protein J26TS2_00400 [Shouchella clausii]
MSDYTPEQELASRKQFLRYIEESVHDARYNVEYHRKKLAEAEADYDDKVRGMARQLSLICRLEEQIAEKEAE